MGIPQPLQDALIMLDAWGTFVVTMERAKSFEEAQAGIEEIKTVADRHYKRLALIAHPDCGGSEERMKVLNQAAELVKQLNIQPPPAVVHVRVYHGGFATSTTSTTGGWYG